MSKKSEEEKKNELYTKVECEMSDCFANEEDDEGKGWCQCLSEKCKKKGAECPFYKTREFKKAQELRLYGQEADAAGMYFLNIGED